MKLKDFIKPIQKKTKTYTMRRGIPTRSQTNGGGGKTNKCTTEPLGMNNLDAKDEN